MKQSPIDNPICKLITMLIELQLTQLLQHPLDVNVKLKVRRYKMDFRFSPFAQIWR